MRRRHLTGICALLGSAKRGETASIDAQIGTLSDTLARSAEAALYKAATCVTRALRAPAMINAEIATTQKRPPTFGGHEDHQTS